jgi:hypothetical protein
MRMRTILLRTPLLAMFVWLAFLTAGCGSKEKPTGEVFGKVTVGGKPVTAGMVKFVPHDKDREPMTTGLGPDGSYRATGVPVGLCSVAVETAMFKNLTPPPPAIAKQLGGPRTKYVPIPEKYERVETSGLSVEVDRGKKQLDIEIP